MSAVIVDTREVVGLLLICATPVESNLQSLSLLLSTMMEDTTDHKACKDAVK